MQKTIKKYLRELNKLTKTALDENGSVRYDYDKIIYDTTKDYSIKIFKEVKQTVGNKYDDKIIKLEILYYLLDEEGFNYTNKIMENINQSNKWTAEAKVRLFMMFVKLLNEIIYLLKGGYSSATLARVRGLYEIGVHLEIILKNGEDIAEKYLKHCNTTRLEIAKSISDEDLIKEIKEQLKEYSNYEYEKNNGWASSLFNKKGISFKDLAYTTALDQYYHMYKYSYLSIHPNIYNSLCNLEIKESEKGKNIWVTTPGHEGIEVVIMWLVTFSFPTIVKFFDHEDISKVFIMQFYNEFIQSSCK